MSETTNKGYNLPTVGGDYSTWGDLLNTNWDILDLNLGGVLAVNAAGNSNITVSAGNAQNLAHVLSGTLTGNIEYILPDVGGFYLIENATSGSFTVDVIASGGTGVVVPQGATQLIWSDGVNAYAGAPATTTAAVWNDVGVARNTGTVYTNTHSEAIDVSIVINNTGTGPLAAAIAVNGTTITEQSPPIGGGVTPLATRVPIGQTYELVQIAGTLELISWFELF